MIDDQFGGSCSLHHIVIDSDDPKRNVCELGIAVSPEYHRGRYGTLAIYELFKYAFEDASPRFHQVEIQTGALNRGMRGAIGIEIEPVKIRTIAWEDKAGHTVGLQQLKYVILLEEWKESVKASFQKRLERFLLPY